MTTNEPKSLMNRTAVLVAVVFLLVVINGIGRMEAHGQEISQTTEILISNYVNDSSDYFDGDDSELSIEVGSKVYVSIKVCDGDLEINGWDRDEVRAFVSEGDPFEFRVLERDSKSNKPIWVEIQSKTDMSAKRTSSRFEYIGYRDMPKRFNCLEGDKISLDIPRNASIRIEGEADDMNISDIHSLEIGKGSGDINLANIENGVRVKTYGGDITATDLGGTVDIVSTNGDTSIYKTRSSDPGDYLSVKAFDGGISLQSIGHRDVKTSTVSGDINFEGKVFERGRYNFSSQQGDINLRIPELSSCKVSATLGGAFRTDISFSDFTIAQAGELKSVSGKLGTGSGVISVSTIGGSLGIRKLD